jgi:hypothetical protein
MARCDVEGCDWYGKASGKPIHMAKAHGIHPTHEVKAEEAAVPGERLLEPIVQRWSP